MTMARYRHRVFAGWLIAVTAGLIGLPHLLSSVTAPALDVSGSESQRVSRILADQLPTLGAEQAIAVLHSPVRRTTDPAFRAAIDAGSRALANSDSVSGVLLLPVAGDPDRPLPLGDSLEPLRPLFHDEHTAYLFVGLSGDDRHRQEQSPALQTAFDQAARTATDGSVRGYVIGVSAFGHLFQQFAITDLMRIELIAVPLAIAVLWWGLRRPMAALVPMIIAGASTVTTLGVLALSTGVLTVDGMLLVGVNAIGLGVGIDYALFVMNRYREELAAGVEPEHAIGTAIATTGRTVLYSGLILVLACSSLFVLRWHVFTQIAVGTMVAIVVASMASVTLLPAVLLSVTDRLERRTPREPQSGNENARPGRLARWSEHLMRHPWPYAVAITAGLLCAAIPAADMSLGLDLERRALAGTTYLTGLTLGARDVPGGSGLALVLVQQPAEAIGDIRPLEAALRADPETVAVATIDVGDGMSVLLVVPNQPIDSPPIAQWVRRIRTDIAPTAAPPGAEVLVGGPSGVATDILGEVSAKLWWVVGLVLMLMFTVLVMVLRSLLLPLKALAMNLLATGAAYGLTVLVFQHTGSGVIWPQVPLIVFVLLFGLSTDYELFLVRRIQEEYLITADNRGSVVAGLRSTARPISLAAVILAVGYGSLLISRLDALREFGFAIAAALIIDATLIRLVLVPALMQIMGRWNWWFPRWPIPAAERDECPVGITTTGRREINDGTLY
ncbi:MMPL family transporter [Nocardia sp. NPDC051570]|uniref:MMPL family transporter n=1 Tax=Nocardia sp. NPDC051570 TaxID=3364324 RepID=UPI0037949886